MSPAVPHRRADTLDVAASLLARGLSPWAERIDQLRLDLRGVLTPFQRRRPAPVRTAQGGPLPPLALAEIDPLYELLPPGAAERYAMARRDLRAVIDGLQGKHPPPLVDRPKTAQPAAQRRAATDAARALRVVEVERETADAVSVVLEDPSGREIDFVPGQFLTVVVQVRGESLRRAYSICSAPSDKRRVRIAVKRVQDGRVSNHINDQLRVGQTLRVLGPSGNFTCAPDAQARRHVVLLGGGSGITPLMAIARGVLESEPGSRVTLVYGNRGVDDIIFRQALERLAGEYPERFILRHVLSDPPADWQGGTGMLDAETVQRELQGLTLDDGLASSFYVCGPEPMMAACRETLLARQVPEAHIHEESFVAPGLRSGSPVRSVSEPQDVEVLVAGQTRKVRAEADQTLLDAGLNAGLPLKFSCAMGGCGACKVKLHEGEVDAEGPNCLSSDEAEAGYVLACVSRPTSPCRIEVE